MESCLRSYGFVHGGANPSNDSHYRETTSDLGVHFWTNPYGTTHRHPQNPNYVNPIPILKWFLICDFGQTGTTDFQHAISASVVLVGFGNGWHFEIFRVIELQPATLGDENI